MVGYYVIPSENFEILSVRRPSVQMIQVKEAGTAVYSGLGAKLF